MSEHGQQIHPDLAGELSGPVEALLLMADEPLSTLHLARVLEVPTEVVEDTLHALRDFYDRTGRGFELRHLAGGWRYWTRPEHADVLGRAVLQGQSARLSQAALETLAVVAYLQPVSRVRLSAVRGVSVDGVVRTLLTRAMIEEAGQDPVTGAVVFRTTDTFLERLGLESLDQLPDLAPHLPDASVLEAELGQLVTAPAPSTDPPDTDAPSTDAPSTDAPSTTGPARPAAPERLPDETTTDTQEQP